jgi:DNA-binding NarL/FixJ family response regulator
VPCAHLRNCIRCGQEFRGETARRVCSACRLNQQERKINPGLSFRERQVVRLVCQAKLNKEIAYELHLTEGTIKEYLNRIFRKLGFTNRTELAVWALTRGRFPEGDVGRLEEREMLRLPHKTIEAGRGLSREADAIA